MPALYRQPPHCHRLLCNMFATVRPRIEDSKQTVFESLVAPKKNFRNPSA